LANPPNIEQVGDWWKFRITLIRFTPSQSITL
jgi:hypothetical protein